MTVLIEDSPRNLVTWITDAASRGLTNGAVITPFATPWARLQRQGRKRSAREAAEQIHDAGVGLWFDATTHALQMAGVGDFRFYDEYELWAGPRGDLSTPAFREEHVRLVFQLQDQLGATHLAPTLLLHHAESDTSERALDLAREAVRQNPHCWLSIAGTAPFWGGHSALDAHIGALAQLEPGGWFLTVARPIGALPVEAAAEEVYGLCRTTRALSEYAPVHISHGDLAALPAIAAGAQSLGSGWDQRQRVCAFASYAGRDDATEGGGGWYERPTFGGLLGSLKANEAAVLERQDRARAVALGPRPAPGPKEAFLHHLTVMNGVIAPIAHEPDYERRWSLLRVAYTRAAGEWPDVVRITGSPLNASDWIDELADGMELYARDEGW